MSKVSYTKPQRYAIFEDCGNILVSAAAGSGKTFTLSSHIVELIKSGKAEMDEMLVVTFTRTAAADMKRKIGESLSRAAREAKTTDSEAYARLSRSASRVQSADISTIHSFLYRTLKRYFSKLGLPQDTRLVSDAETTARLKAEVMRDVTNDLFEAGDADFLMLADILSTVRETDRLDTELYDIAARLSSVGLDHRALGEYADMLGSTVGSEKDFLSSPFGKPIRESIGEMIEHYSGVFHSLAEDFELFPDVNEKYGDELIWLTEWTDDVKKDLEAGNLASIREKVLGFSRPRLTPIGKAKCELSENFKFCRDEMKKAVADLAKKVAKFLPEEIVLSRDGTVRVLRYAENVLGKFFDGYKNKKRELSMMDYGDLESLALELLTDEKGEPSPEAHEIGAKYKYVFIDEYQDTNRTQDAIFRAISQNARRFMVGDIKQAIYRFRGADPSVFSEYRRSWESIDPENDGGYDFSADEGRVLHMSDNFRSAEPVTNLTNAVSDSILPFGGIPYGGGDRLICSRDGGKDPSFADAEVVLIEKKQNRSHGEDDEDDEENGDGVDREIEYVVDRVASIVGRQLGERIVRPGDVAILLRKKDNMTVYRDALIKRGIPAFVDRERTLSVSPAVMLMICLLNFVDNPLRDVYSAGALRSPVFGFDVNELVKVREYAGKMPLYMGVIGCAADENRDDELRSKCEFAVRWIEREKTVSRGMSARKYLEYLLDAVSVFSIDGIRENGEERNAVNRLCKMAAEFESSAASSVGRADLSAFVDYVAESFAEAENSGEKPSVSPDAVSILTIHKSKGLEFPVCFVAECGRTFISNKDSQKTLLFDKDLGIGMYLPDDSGLARCDTVFRLAVSEKNRREDTLEEMRILYVALSRACEKLIVTAKVSSLDRVTERAERSAGFSDGYSVKTTSKYIDWIMEALTIKPTERVTVRMYADGEEFDIEASDAALKESADAGAEEFSWEGVADGGGFVYPYGYLEKIPSKLTVSKLSPTILDDDGPEEIADIAQALDSPEETGESGEIKLKKPDFMTGTKSAAANEIGSATHVFMQFTDFGKLRKNGAAAERDRLVSERYISVASARLVDLRQIERFMNSGLMDKMARSDFVKREFRFNVLMDAGDFTADEDLALKLGEHGVKVTVQGVVDCVYRDPDTGELILIDYKTDSLTPAEKENRYLAENKLRARHKNQLTYYKKICTQMFGEEIKHAYVYSTVLGDTVEV